MYQRAGVPATGSTKRPPNKGTSVDDGPVRDHVFTHNFVGGNSLIPGRFGSEAKSKMTEERLKNAATLSIDTQKARKGELTVTITNSGAGHDLPTGLTDVRQMWLEITLRDEKGARLFSSGTPDNKGYLPENAIVFNTMYGDGKGNPVLNIATAREILKEKRIPPPAVCNRKNKIYRETLEKPEYSCQTALQKRPQKVIDRVMGKERVVLPIITMSEIEKKFTL